MRRLIKSLQFSVTSSNSGTNSQSPSWILLMVSSSSSPRKGEWPDTRMYPMTPTDHMSEA